MSLCGHSDQAVSIEVLVFQLTVNQAITFNDGQGIVGLYHSSIPASVRDL